MWKRGLVLLAVLSVQSAYCQLTERAYFGIPNGFYVSTQRMVEDTTVLQGKTTYGFADIKLGKGMLGNSRPQGFWTYYHTNGKVRANGMYVNGFKHGEWIYYHPSGNEQARGTYHKGQPLGEWKSYNHLGNLLAEVEFLPGQALDRFATFYPSGDTSLVRSFEIIEGVICGEERSFYEKGPLCEEYGFKVDTSAFYSKYLLGSGRSFLASYFLAPNPDGQLLPEPTLKYHGNYRRYHETGHLWEHRVYYDGLLVNVFESKNQWGTRLDNGTFRDGTGSLIRYHQNQDTASVFNFSNGLLHGGFFVKESGERLLAKGAYHHGQPAGTWTLYNINQRPAARWTFAQDEIQTSWINNSGIVTAEGMFKLCLHEGRWVTLDFLGDTLSVSHYESGLLTGPHSTYQLGQVQERGNYYKGLRVGTWRTYSPSGKVSFQKDHGSDPVVWSPPIVGEPIRTRFPLEDGFKDRAFFSEGGLLGLAPEEITLHINKELYSVWFTGNSRDGEVVIRCMADEAGMITDFQSVKYANKTYKEEAEKLIRGMGAIRPATLLGIPHKSVFFVSYYFEKL